MDTYILDLSPYSTNCRPLTLPPLRMSFTKFHFLDFQPISSKQSFSQTLSIGKQHQIDVAS